MGRRISPCLWVRLVGRRTSGSESDSPCHYFFILRRSSEEWKRKENKVPVRRLRKFGYRTRQARGGGGARYLFEDNDRLRKGNGVFYWSNDANLWRAHFMQLDVHISTTIGYHLANP